MSEYYATAKALKAKGEGDSAMLDKLLSYPATHGHAISVACQLLHVVDQCWSVFRERHELDAGQRNRFCEQGFTALISELDRQAPKRFPYQEKRWWQELSRYLCGDGDPIVLGAAKENRWQPLRQRVASVPLEAMQRELELVSYTESSSEERLEPLIQELQMKALQAIRDDEVQGRDAVKTFTDMVKLQAQLKGELKEKVDIEISPGQAYKELLLNPGRFHAEVLEGDEPPRLIG